eukprot:6519932-Prymnesium_polylepis.1
MAGLCDGDALAALILVAHAHAESACRWRRCGRDAPRVADGRELGLAVGDAAIEGFEARLVVLDLLIEPPDVERGVQLRKGAGG